MYKRILSDEEISKMTEGQLRVALAGGYRKDDFKALMREYRKKKTYPVPKKKKIKRKSWFNGED